MNYWKVIGKFAKHAALAAAGAVVGAIQVVPPGQPVDWPAVAVAAAYAALTAGLGGGGLNAWKHRGTAP